MEKALKWLVVLAVAYCACGESYPEPQVGLREATCKASVLLYVLGDNEALINQVLAGEMGIADAVSLTGGMEEDVNDAIDRLHLCEPLPVRSPPPQYGNKVL